MQHKKTAIKKLLSSAFNIGKIIIILLFVCYSKKTNAQENGKSQIKTFQNVEIPGTQVREIYSSIVGQEYKLHINLPRYFEDTSKTFPVVYLLDSQWDFPLVQAIYGEQYYDGFLPELIIVGITWGGENPNPDILRYRDFTPTDITQNKSAGNAPKFLEFIKNELIPFMEINYKASKTDRTLIGSSLGGLFTLYALFNQTDLFNRYVLTSPAVAWDNGITFTYEKNYAAKNKNLPINLYMAIGKYETSMMKGFEFLISQIKNSNYKNLKMETKVLEGTGHSGSKAEGYTRGLQYVFEKTVVKVDDEILKKYTGEYQYTPGITIQIVLENGNLIVLTPGNTKIVLYAETEKDFFAKGEFTYVHFKNDDEGNILGFMMQRYEGESFVKKIKEN